MVLPLYDNLRTGRRPWVTWSLIGLNLLVFVLQSLSGQYGDNLFGALAVVPRAVLSPAYWLQTAGWPLITLIGATFLHGSWSHVLGNMLFLWVFGDNVEELLGRFRFVVLYLSCGVLANIAHIFANPQSMVPTIGASGAVAGVLGAYIFSFPLARVLTLIPIGLFVPAIRLPAWVFLGIWFLMQLYSGLQPLWVHDGAQSVAFWAHIAGFLCGIALVRLLRPARLLAPQ